MIQDDSYGTMLNKEKRKKKGERRREEGLRCEGMISCKDLYVVIIQQWIGPTLITWGFGRCGDD
jgi:hypothetical protein